MGTIQKLTWKINSLFTFPEQADKKNVVIKAIFTVTGSNGIKSAFLESVQEFQYIPDNPFIEFEQLNENEVIKWVQNSLGQDKINAIELAIENSINPFANTLNFPTEKSLPWLAQ